MSTDTGLFRILPIIMQPLCDPHSLSLSPTPDAFRMLPLLSWMSLAWWGREVSYFLFWHTIKLLVDSSHLKEYWLHTLFCWVCFSFTFSLNSKVDLSRVLMEYLGSLTWPDSNS